MLSFVPFFRDSAKRRCNGIPKKSATQIRRFDGRHGWIERAQGPGLEKAAER